MELLPDGGRVRLRSRACDMYLRAEEDGVGVSLSPSREPRTAWLVRHVQRQGTAYVLLLDNPTCGHYLALATEPAPPGGRGLRAVQRERGRGDADSEADMVEATWSARLLDRDRDRDRDIVLRHAAVHGDLRPLGCAGAGVVPGQGVRGLLARWSVEAAPPPQLPHPAVARGDAPDQGQGPVVVGEEVDLPAPDAAAAAEADRLAALEQAIRNKKNRIGEALNELLEFKEDARATGENPDRQTVRRLEGRVVHLQRDRRNLETEAAALRNAIDAE